MMIPSFSLIFFFAVIIVVGGIIPSSVWATFTKSTFNVGGTVTTPSDVLSTFTVGGLPVKIVFDGDGNAWFDNISYAESQNIESKFLYYNDNGKQNGLTDFCEDISGNKFYPVKRKNETAPYGEYINRNAGNLMVYISDALSFLNSNTQVGTSVESAEENRFRIEEDEHWESSIDFASKPVPGFTLSQSNSLEIGLHGFLQIFDKILPKELPDFRETYIRESLCLDPYTGTRLAPYPGSRMYYDPKLGRYLWSEDGEFDDNGILKLASTIDNEPYKKMEDNFVSQYKLLTSDESKWTQEDTIKERKLFEKEKDMYYRKAASVFHDLNVKNATMQIEKKRYNRLRAQLKSSYGFPRPTSVMNDIHISQNKPETVGPYFKVVHGVYGLVSSYALIASLVLSTVVAVYICLGFRKRARKMTLKDLIEISKHQEMSQGNDIIENLNLGYKIDDPHLMIYYMARQKLAQTSTTNEPVVTDGRGASKVTPGEPNPNPCFVESDDEIAEYIDMVILAEQIYSNKIYYEYLKHTNAEPDILNSIIFLQWERAARFSDAFRTFSQSWVLNGIYFGSASTHLNRIHAWSVSGTDKFDNFYIQNTTANIFSVFTRGETFEAEKKKLCDGWLKSYRESLKTDIIKLFNSPIGTTKDDEIFENISKFTEYLYCFNLSMNGFDKVKLHNGYDQEILKDHIDKQVITPISDLINFNMRRKANIPAPTVVVTEAKKAEQGSLLASALAANEVNQIAIIGLREIIDKQSMSIKDQENMLFGITTRLNLNLSQNTSIRASIEILKGSLTDNAEIKEIEGHLDKSDKECSEIMTAHNSEKKKREAANTEISRAFKSVIEKYDSLFDPDSKKRQRG
jgi:hypothetical protein